MNMQQTFIDALFDPELALPDHLASHDGNRARFAVYRNNVRASLTQALADTFPVCLQLVGEDFFRAMAGVYIGQTAPTSPLLTDYGHSLPAFIDAFPPAVAVPYLADMARLELAWLAALHAADPSRLNTGALAALLADPQQVAGLRLQLQPSARQLSSPHAVVSLWRAHQGQLNIAEVDPSRAEQVLLLRPALQVLLLPLDAAGAVFIEQLSQQPLGAALEHTLSRHPHFAPEQTLALLLRHQAIARFYPAGDNT